MSDGELDEGSTWEAAMSAGHYKLDNLIAIVDVNNAAGRRPVDARCWTSSRWPPKWEAFGWFTSSASTATTSTAWCAAFDAARRPRPSRSRAMIICDTMMGKGVPFLEAREKNHFIRVEEHEWQLALEALDAGRTA